MLNNILMIIIMIVVKMTFIINMEVIRDENKTNDMMRILEIK